MTLPNRSYSSPAYRYGFQGQEKDDEIKGEGNSINYTFRMHDPRVGRFFAVDPLEKSYPWNSPYAFSENRVIDSGELEGLERYYAADGAYLGKFGKSDEISIVRLIDIDRAKDYIVRQVHGESLFINSQTYSEANKFAQENVTKSILKNDLRTNVKSVNAIQNVNNGTGGSTVDAGEFRVYTHLQKNGEFLQDNYYNQLNIFYHEKQHDIAFQNVIAMAGVMDLNILI